MSQPCTSLPPSSSRGKSTYPKTLEEEFGKRKPYLLSPHPKTQLGCCWVPTDSYSTSFSLPSMDKGTVSHRQNRGWLTLLTQGVN